MNKTKQIAVRCQVERRSQTGFTIIELVVAVAMVVIIASLALPILNPGRRSDLDRARQAAYEFAKLRDAINGFEPTLPISSFKQTTGANPQSLSDLTTRIGQTGSNSLNSCGTAYTAAQVAAWSSSAPYWNAPVTPTGLILAPGYAVQDLMIVTKSANFSNLTTPDSSQLARIRMPSVSLNDAQNLALIVDGDVNPASVGGTVSFTPSGVAAIPVDYLVVLRGC